jgi:hypothetical protein
LEELSNRAARLSNALGACLAELQSTVPQGAPITFFFARGGVPVSPSPPWPPR